MTDKNLLTTQDGNVFTIMFNREARMNAMTARFLADLKVALDSAKFDDSVSVVVLKATAKAFTTGYDLDGSDWILSQNPIELQGKLNIDRDREDIKALLEYWWSMWKFPKPIIAQMQGLCLPGGGELIAMCDLVVAAETARFGHLAGRDLGIREVDNEVWIVSFLDYDLGYFDKKEDRVEPGPNPFAPEKVLTISPE